MEIFFDGYCPESMLKGEKIEMRLNEDDFWESEGTGLQLVVLPPFAAILRWRGKGKFKESSDVASKSISGLILTEVQREESKEIYPDDTNIIKNKFDLEWYLDEVYNSKEEFDAAKLNLKDAIFKKQEQYLNSIQQEEFQRLVYLFDKIRENGSYDSIFSSESFQVFHKMLYDLKIIFDFDWMAWYDGWNNINDINFDYSTCSILEKSMYLTAIFRADRFSDGSLEMNFRNGTVRNIFNSFR